MTIETIKVFISSEISLLAMFLTVPFIIGLTCMIVEEIKDKDKNKKIVESNTELLSKRELNTEKKQIAESNKNIRFLTLALIIVLVITFFSYNWCYNTIMASQQLEVEINDKLYDGYRAFILYDDGRKPTELINYEYRDVDRQYYTIEINNEKQEIYLKNYIQPSV